MDYIEFQSLMNDINSLPLSSTIGGGYSYNKSLVFGVLNNHLCYEIMSDLSNKEMTHVSPWSSIEQDELLHSIENLTGFSTYYWSKKSYVDCLNTAEASFDAIEKKGLLEYGDKKNSDRLIKQIAFGVSIKSEAIWHSPDIWALHSWYKKIPLIDDGHMYGENKFFDEV